MSASASLDVPATDGFKNVTSVINAAITKYDDPDTDDDDEERRELKG